MDNTAKNTDFGGDHAPKLTITSEQRDELVAIMSAPPPPPLPSFGRYEGMARAIEAVDLDAIAKAEASKAARIAHHKKARTEATVRLSQVRDELAARERDGLNKRVLINRLLDGKSALERTKADLAEEREALIAGVSALNGEINDLEAMSRDFPRALDGIRGAAVPLVPIIRSLARTDLRTSYADAFVLSFSLECEPFRDLYRNLGDVLIAGMDAGIYERGSIRASDEMVALVQIAAPLWEAVGRRGRLTINAPWPNRATRVDPAQHVTA